SFDGSADFALGRGDFTIDFRVRPASVGGSDQNFFDASPVVNGPYPAIFMNNVSHHVSLFVNGGKLIYSTTALSNNQWYHIAVVRFQGNTKLYINGINEGSTYADTNDYLVGAGLPVIGVNGSTLNSSFFNGWIDEVRVIKGFAAWTSNFTPPAGPYSPDISGLRDPFYHVWRALDEIPRSWTWSYNLNLIGQDKLPFRQKEWPLTPAPERSNELLTWIERVKLLLLVPFKQS